MFFRDHSLSLVLGGIAAVGIFLSWLHEPGTFQYDFWMTFGGGFGTTAIFVIASRWFYEKDADPSKPPK